MAPVTLGTQAMGSIIRPSSYCGVHGFKLSFGALNRGGGHSLIPSRSYIGTHANSLEDVWQVAAYIAETAGGDGGHNALSSGLGVPALSLPKLTADGLPLGVQLVGFRERDADLAAIAAWVDRVPG